MWSSMQKLTASYYKDFSEGLAGSTEVEKERMEIHLPAPLLNAVDEKADKSEEYSSRSELVRQALRDVVGENQ